MDALLELLVETLLPVMFILGALAPAIVMSRRSVIASGQALAEHEGEDLAKHRLLRRLGLAKVALAASVTLAGLVGLFVLEGVSAHNWTQGGGSFVIIGLTILVLCALVLLGLGLCFGTLFQTISRMEWVNLAPALFVAVLFLLLTIGVINEIDLFSFGSDEVTIVDLGGD